jgi:hypothetical protein
LQIHHFFATKRMSVVFEVRIELPIPFHFLGTRWVDPEQTTISGSVPLMAIRPAPLGVAHFGGMIGQAANNKLCITHPGIKELPGFFIRSVDIFFTPRFFTTVKENSKAVILTAIVNVGKTSFTVLQRVHNEAGDEVGYSVGTAVAIDLQGKLLNISPESLLRQGIDGSLFEKYVKSQTLPKLHIGLETQYDFVAPLYLRSSDLDLFLHAGQSRYLHFALDSLDYALSLEGNDSDWANKVRKYFKRRSESTHNLPWKRTYYQMAGQLKLHDKAEVRMKFIEEEVAIEFLIVKLSKQKTIICASAKCWLPDVVSRM